VRRRPRFDLLLWGLLAGASAGVVLGLTGGGWGRAAVLALLVVAGFVLLTLLTATSSGAGRRRTPERPERPGPPDHPADP
jgi:uncharacterized membrane protein YfcA